MSQQTHVLVDSAAGIVHEGLVAEGRTSGSRWSVQSRVLRGGRSEGVHVVELDNGAMCADILPTRGMGIWRISRGENTLGWESPVPEPVHPAFVPLMEPAGLGWLAGFNELLCRCGLENNGAPEFDEIGRLVRPLHGRIANSPAHRLELVVDEVAGLLHLRGVVDESRFHFQSLRMTTTYTTAIGSNELSWSDHVINIGGRDALLQMLYHFNVGLPALQPGAMVHAPALSVAPHSKVAAAEGVERWSTIPPPRPGTSEQVYLLDPAGDASGEVRVLFSGLKGGEAVSLRFNKGSLPCFSIWRNTPAVADGYVVGLEPGTNYPNPRTFEQQQGRAITLKGGESWQASISAVWHTDAKSIADEERWIATTQGSKSPTLSSNARKELTAGA